jgi:aminoglycoside phosphotransferase (APT) family kinase protein
LEIAYPLAGGNGHAAVGEAESDGQIGRGDGQIMIGRLKSCLLDRAAEWGLPQSEKWSFLFYNNYHPHCSDMDILWFLNTEKYPRVVTKISREPERPGREFANLRQVHAAAPKWTPRPLDYCAEGSFWTLWMEGVPGTRFGGRPTSDVLRPMVETIAGIHRALSAPPERAQTDRFRDAVAEPLRILSEFGASPVPEGCRRLLAAAGAERLESLPVIPQHGDLYDGNLLRHPGGWYVVDWESFGMVDLPAYDLYTLLLSLLLADGATCRQWRPELVAQISGLVKLYGERLGLAEAELATMLPLTLANWFYVQWRDGRASFLKRMYPTIADYFENRERWETVFLSRAGEWLQ